MRAGLGAGAGIFDFQVSLFECRDGGESRRKPPVATAGLMGTGRGVPSRLPYGGAWGAFQITFHLLITHIPLTMGKVP